MTPRRTLPSAFPLVSLRDVYSYRIASGHLLRKVAQAQNYLWARAGRIYGNFCYEGHGWRATYNETSPYTLTTPGGNIGICIGSFICPPNYGASATGKISMTFALAGASSKTVTIEMVLYELDGTFISSGSSMSASGTSGNVTATQAMSLSTGNRPIQCKVFMSVAGLAAGGDDVQALHISARYLEDPGVINNETLSGIATWDFLSTLVLDGYSMSAALLGALVRNTICLWARRPWEICQAYLATQHAPTASRWEIGRYVVWVSPRVDKLSCRLQVQATHTGNVYIKVNGVQVGTSAVAVGQHAITFTDFVHGLSTASGGVEATFTVEADSTAANTDWGTIVNGVSLWESSINLALFGGATVPTDYTPIDENYLAPDMPIVSELNGSSRAGITTLIRNDIWLARNRLRWLVGDWRHKTQKKIVNPDTGNPEDIYDWTYGQSGTAFLSAMRNITVMPVGTSHDADDGYGNFFTGVGTATGMPPGSGDTRWPSSLTYSQHGARLARFPNVTPTGMTGHKAVTGARLSTWVYARRLGPFADGNFINSQSGPAVKDKLYKNAARIYADYAGVTKAWTHYLVAADDRQGNWYGPATYQHGGAADSNVDLYGHPQRADGSLGTFEGLYFELELMGALVMDEPLPQSALDALA
jgi:hypothetical protein